MSTTRTTYGALLGTVTTVASAATNLIGQLDTTIGMAGRALDDAARRQKARSIIDSESYKDTISNEKARELLQQTEEIAAWLGNDEARITEFTNTRDRLRKLLD